MSAPSTAKPSKPAAHPRCLFLRLMLIPPSHLKNGTHTFPVCYRSGREMLYFRRPPVVERQNCVQSQITAVLRTRVTCCVMVPPDRGRQPLFAARDQPLPKPAFTSTKASPRLRTCACATPAGMVRSMGVFFSSVKRLLTHGSPRHEDEIEIEGRVRRIT